MLLNLVAFLCAFFQLFHCGKDRITINANKHVSYTAAGHDCTFHKRYAAKIFACIIGLEETEDTDTDVSFQKLYDLPGNRQLVTADFFQAYHKAFSYYNISSGQCDRHLFLFHCSFRV